MKPYRDMTVREWFALTGEHRLAFDRALSVQVPRKKHKPEHPQRWRGGDLYNYGDVPPRYPMPAIRGWNNAGRINGRDNSGGVEGDYVMVGAMYVDWSRGSIEVY